MTTIQLVLSLVAVFSAGLAIYAKFRGPKRLEYIGKPLAMAAIIGIALSDDDPISASYQILIVLGLIASLVGDVLLMLPANRLMQGLFSFLIAHVFYAAAFTFEGNGAAPIWYIAPFVLYGAVVLWRLWPDLGSMRIAVLIYVATILFMAWQAANRWIETEDEGAFLALMGAYLFVMSDSALAVERFKGRFRAAPFWVLSTYFAAQLLIAMSV